MPPLVPLNLGYSVELISHLLWTFLGDPSSNRNTWLVKLFCPNSAPRLQERNKQSFFFFFSIHGSSSFLEVCVGRPDKKHSKSCWFSGDGVYGLSLLVLAASWVKWHRPHHACFLKVLSFIGIISATLHSSSYSNTETLDWFFSYLH